LRSGEGALFPVMALEIQLMFERQVNARKLSRHGKPLSTFVVQISQERFFRFVQALINVETGEHLNHLLMESRARYWISCYSCSSGLVGLQVEVTQN
jgi:hypothetical protein